jgi:hypothetical protein
MGLSTNQGDIVEVKAAGPDADHAGEALAALIAGGCGEKAGEVRQPEAPGASRWNAPAFFQIRPTGYSAIPVAPLGTRIWPHHLWDSAG